MVLGSLFGGYNFQSTIREYCRAANWEIADLEDQTRVEEGAIAEAFTYRSFDISEGDWGGEGRGGGGDPGRAARRWRVDG